MSELVVSDDVRELIDDIITRNNWGPVLNVKYFPGSEVGDGYASKHAAVEIIKEDKIIRLFVKYALEMKSSENMPVESFYVNEILFYDVIYPTYLKFLREKNIEDGFRNAPKCYGTSVKSVIVLENIKERGFTLFDRKTIMNEEHIILSLKAFAKYHAVSFAFKDQEKEKHERLVESINLDATTVGEDSPFAKVTKNMINEALTQLDAVADKHILEKCDAADLSSTVVNVGKYSDQYSIITKGDCWCNNMMFLYEEGNRNNPIDVMLVDWQMLRLASPVYDISYFFYTIASAKALSKLDFYLNIYYTELCEQIKKMGSDPDHLYPLEIFRKEWKRHCKYGFGLAFMLFKFMLANKDEAPKMEEYEWNDAEKMNTMSLFPSKIASEDEYIRRIKILAEFMINNDYL